MVLWFMLCVLIGVWANKKGRNGWAWGLASIFLTPLLIGITLALTPDAKDENTTGTLSDDAYEGHDDGKICPECGYHADAGEQFCPRCGEMLW